MAFSYFETNPRLRLSIPQTIRLRNRYRGQRESEKFNLEVQQFRFDLFRLTEKYYVIKSYIESVKDTLFSDGGAVSGVSYHNSTANTTSNLSIEGVDELTAKINRLEKRINDLEGA